jgi:hypothetical protein
MEKPRPLPQRRRRSQNRRAQQQEEQQCHIDAEPLLTSDEARRIAANIAKLLELLCASRHRQTRGEAASERGAHQKPARHERGTDLCGARKGDRGSVVARYQAPAGFGLAGAFIRATE